ncbi:MAG: hypothetical protein FVQ79_13000, partial [Planctomycetes bacterium]|nr:hypothetical protein [Planctomycetota bacterium]
MFNPSGLAPSTSYTYTVQMKDSLGNTGSASTAVSVTTFVDGSLPNLSGYSQEDTVGILLDMGVTIGEVTSIHDATSQGGYFSGYGGGYTAGDVIGGGTVLDIVVSNVWFVDVGMSGVDGTSWTNAYDDLQDALSNVSSTITSGTAEIWVAAGTYYPSQEVDGTDDRYKTFQMINGVAIYGGFNGTETALDQRDVQSNVTILSGDLLNDDDPATPIEDLCTAPSRTDNCYHIFYHPDGTGLDATAILNGLTIAAGNANGSEDQGRGGGMYNYGSSPTVSNCTFSGNSAGISGGGMRNEDNSSPTVSNCTFTGNLADSTGGGMLNYNSSPTVSNCTFRGNSAASGGGMNNHTNSAPTVSNCTFSGNSSSHGGGMFNYTNSNPTVSNCTFSGNSAGVLGGGMYNYTNSNPTVTNCILWGNTAPTGNEIYNLSSSIPIISHCDIAGSGGSGAWDSSLGTDGGGNIDADPTFVDADGEDNTVGTEDDNLRLSAGSSCIDVGDDAAATETFDPDGRLRILDGDDNSIATIDMGTYEYVTATNDTYAPIPNPARFASVPVAVGDSAISMTAATGFDYNGPVEYFFTCISGNGPNSSWQESNVFNPSGLTSNTLYTYTVKARDAVLNETAPSAGASATTDPEDDPPTPDPASFATAPYVTGIDSIAMIATTGSDLSGPIEYFFHETSGNSGGTDSGWQTGASYTDSGLAANVQYSYTVQMRDALENTGTASGDASATISVKYVFNYNNIQAAIDDSSNGDIIVLERITYEGEGNRDIDFDGRKITLQSLDPSDWDDVASTIIDCQGTASDPHRGFYFHNGETANSVVSGITITGGYASDTNGDSWFDGGAIAINGSSPTIANCIIKDNGVSATSDGLVAHWTLDEPDGITAYDSVGTNNGTLYNGPSWMPSGGEIDGALSFDGTDKYVSLPKSTVAALQIGTASVWINPDSTAYGRFLALCDTTGWGHVGFAYSKPGTPVGSIAWQVNGAEVVGYTVSNTAPVGEWTHVAITVDSGGNTMYINGVKQTLTYSSGDASSEQFFDDISNGSNLFTLGKRDITGTTSDTYFNGKIDDVRIFSRALSAIEIKRLYLNKDAGGGILGNGTSAKISNC